MVTPGPVVITVAFIGCLVAGPAGAAFVLGRRALIDLPTILICIGTFIVLARFKVQEPLVTLAAGALGIALSAI